MTAPADATVLFVLVSVFAAATGYAAGRLHQWYRMDSDRDEAYRAGYDTATRSTFSMAARVLGPRRDRAAVRASASVQPSAPLIAQDPRPEQPPPPSTGAENGTEPAGSGPPAGVFAPVVRPAKPTDTPSPDAAQSRPARSRPGRSTGRLPGRGRHLVPEELVNGPTYRLTPDRVARAKVVGALPPPDPAEEDAASPPAVPKPRTS